MNDQIVMHNGSPVKGCYLEPMLLRGYGVEGLYHIWYGRQSRFLFVHSNL